MMKKLVVLLLALACCAGLFGGCVAVEYKPDSGFDVRAGTDDLKKTQQIKITDAATGAVLAAFDSEQEIEHFLTKLDEDSWRIKDLADTPPEAERECAIIMMQTETVKAGMDPADAEITQLCTMYTYRDSSCLTMEFPFASFTFTLGDSAAEYLHSFAK